MLFEIKNPANHAEESSTGKESMQNIAVTKRLRSVAMRMIDLVVSIILFVIFSEC